METTGNMTPQEQKIQGLLDRFLASRPSNRAENALHLDDDTLSAFTEGTLSEREAAPIVSHLVDCGFCRHMSAELVKLHLEFASEPETARSEAHAAEPAKISEVLSRMFANIFGTADHAVTAHEEKEQVEAEKKDENE